eukprot:3215129-Pyramimonas_sp.AAC.1
MSSVGVLLLSKLLEPTSYRHETYKIEDFTKIFCEVLCFDSEHSYACKELYGVPGGDQLAAVPPRALSGNLARRGPPRAALCRA